MLNFPVRLSLFTFDSHSDLYDTQVYAHYGSTCLSSFTIWDAIPVYWFSDPAAIRTIMTEKTLFQKDLSTVRPWCFRVRISYLVWSKQYKGALDLYGATNVVTTEGSEWKNHRQISRPTFNEVCPFLVTFVHDG